MGATRVSGTLLLPRALVLVVLIALEAQAYSLRHGSILPTINCKKLAFYKVRTHVW